MPYKRKKPFFQRHQTILINILTVLVFGALVLTAVMLTPRAIEHQVSGYGIDNIEDEKR